MRRARSLVRLLGAFVVLGTLLATTETAVATQQAAVIVAPANPPGAEGSLSSVSCWAPEECVSVGYQSTTDGSEVPLVYGRNGNDAGRWTRLPFPISAPTTVNGSFVLTGVSCVSERFCQAVGTGNSRSGAQIPLAATFDGHRWSVAATPVPLGARAARFDGVTCTSPSWCVAVGQVTDATGASFALAEHWNGARWSLDATPLPDQGRPDRFWAVACRSPQRCVAVGEYTFADGFLRAFAELWDGTAWTAQPPINPADAYTSSLRGVACPAGASACFAVGESDVSGKVPGTLMVRRSLVEQWDGSAWAVGTSPSATDRDELSAVSCPSDNRCTAVGTSANGTVPQVVTWDGVTWTAKPAPAASQPPKLVRLWSVSCPSDQACDAVGDAAPGRIPVPVALAKRANRWTTDPLPPPDGAESDDLAAVSCPNAQFCEAVGSRMSSAPLPGATPGGQHNPLAQAWDGHRWQLQHVPVPTGAAIVDFYGVSCVTSTDCMAVGSASFPSAQAFVPLTEHWDGQRWTILPTPFFEGTAYAELFGVSCPAAKTCVAVGYDSNGDQQLILTELWDGARWTIVPGGQLPAGASAPNLLAVSCVRPGACMATGFYLGPTDPAPSTRSFALAEEWDGVRWSRRDVPDPIPSFGRTNSDHFAAVSCGAANRCIAVGNYFTGDGGGYPNPVLVEVWDGRVWKVQATPEPPGARHSIEALSGVSCASATDCTAVGHYDGNTYYGSADNSTHAVAEHYDGTKWTLTAVPDAPGAPSTRLMAVSCLAVAPCTAVGTYQYHLGNDTRWPLYGLGAAEIAWPTFQLTERIGS
jgi:hypothetical protein